MSFRQRTRKTWEFGRKYGAFLPSTTVDTFGPKNSIYQQNFEILKGFGSLDRLFFQNGIELNPLEHKKINQNTNPSLVLPDKLSKANS